MDEDTSDLEDHLSVLLEGLEEDNKKLKEELEQWRDAFEKERRTVRFMSRDNASLRKEVEDQKDKRRREREMLVSWLERRIEQQEQVTSQSFISQESTRVVELEISILRRYREMIVEGEHLKGSEDPPMPRFE